MWSFMFCVFLNFNLIVEYKIIIIFKKTHCSSTNVSFQPSGTADNKRNIFHLFAFCFIECIVHQIAEISRNLKMFYYMAYAMVIDY